MEIIAVRHGRPIRVEGADGAADPELTELGHEQARAVGAFLAGERIDHIVSSPLRRARQTAAPLASTLGIELEVIDDLAEIDQHADSYLPLEEVKAAGGEMWDRIVDDPHGALGFDELPAFRRRVADATENLIAANPGRHVAVFCHGLVIAVMLQHVIGHQDVFALNCEYAALTRITASTSRPLRTVRSFNETSHVRGLLPPRL